MSGPSPFEIARETAGNFSNAFTRVKDESAIENILSNAMQSGNPQEIQNSIGKILSQVSPERQEAAINYLQSAYKNIEANQEKTRKRNSLIDAGLNPDFPDAVLAAQFKEGAKNQRLNSVYGLGGNQPSPNMGQSMQMQGEGQGISQENAAGPNIAQNQPPGFVNQFDKYSNEQLRVMSGHPDREISEPAKQTLLGREAAHKEDRADLREAKKGTQKLREDIANKAAIAQQGIQEKEHLLDIIDTGKIDDPTYAQLVDAIPMKLGQRFLSKETVEYKSGLVNGYRDLRNIFTGATRVKEIELLEEKIADIYLTDEQKKAILRSSINTLNYDIIRADVAAEVERDFPALGVLAFNQKVNELAKPRINALANRVIDEQKAIIQDAENRKKIPLDYNDPESRQIADQIIREVGGDPARPTKKNLEDAKKLAKKKGYDLGG